MNVASRVFPRGGEPFPPDRAGAEARSACGTTRCFGPVRCRRNSRSPGRRSNVRRLPAFLPGSGLAPVFPRQRGFRAASTSRTARYPPVRRRFCIYAPRGLSSTPRPCPHRASELHRAIAACLLYRQVGRTALVFRRCCHRKINHVLTSLDERRIVAGDCGGRVWARNAHPVPSDGATRRPTVYGHTTPGFLWLTMG